MPRFPGNKNGVSLKGKGGGGSRGFKSACAQDKDKMRNYKCDR